MIIIKYFHQQERWLSDFNSLEFNKSHLNQIKEIVIGNSFGQTESYRAYLFDIDPKNEYPDIKYAVVMTSISQAGRPAGSMSS